MRVQRTKALLVALVLLTYIALAGLPHVSHDDTRGQPCAFCQAVQAALPEVASAAVLRAPAAAEWFSLSERLPGSAAPALTAGPTRAPPA